MPPRKQIYKVIFYNQGKVYEVYARSVSQGGFSVSLKSKGFFLEKNSRRGGPFGRGTPTGVCRRGADFYSDACRGPSGSSRKAGNQQNSPDARNGRENHHNAHSNLRSVKKETKGIRAAALHTCRNSMGNSIIRQSPNILMRCVSDNLASHTHDITATRLLMAFRNC